MASFLFAFTTTAVLPALYGTDNIRSRDNNSDNHSKLKLCALVRGEKKISLSPLFIFPELLHSADTCYGMKSVARTRDMKLNVFVCVLNSEEWRKFTFFYNFIIHISLRCRVFLFLRFCPHRTNTTNNNYFWASYRRHTVERESEWGSKCGQH